MITGRIVENFSLDEMMNSLAGEDVKLVLTPEVREFAEMMQELRNWYGKPLEVSSWYRTKLFNASLPNASPKSIHLDGRACDISNTPQDKYNEFAIVWKSICINHNKIGGCNMYDWGMHFDDYEDKFGNKEFVIRTY